MQALRYGIIYSLGALFVIGALLGGSWVLAVPAIVFGFIPMLDTLIGRDDSDPEAYHPLHDLVLRAWVPVQVGLIGFTLALVRDRSAAELVLVAGALGIVTGTGGINIAHELMHRKSKTDRALAEILMTSVSYPWFLVEHVLGHHRWVGTRQDPATARFGETVYRFVPRSIFGGLASFFRIEREYAGRRGIRWWSVQDRRTRYSLTLLATYLALWAIGGWTAVAAFGIQSLVAVVLLEVVNYVEHYGLVRKEVEPGKYERVAPSHSWNSTHWLTNAFLFNLPRHADHHAFASRPYWELRPWPGAPELPLGYASMLIVALIPPLWFRWMNPKALKAGKAGSGMPGSGMPAT